MALGKRARDKIRGASAARRKQIVNASMLMNECGLLGRQRMAEIIQYANRYGSK
jgi:hypothetical protein